MTSPRPSSDLDVEREIDLARWRRAVIRLWWLPVGGLVLGAIVGLLYSFGGGNLYDATALISLGQPVSPGGVVVNGYGTNPRAIAEIVSSAAAQHEAENKADMRAGALRGKVSVQQVGTTTAATGGRAAPLISLTVQSSRPVQAEGAANAMAQIVVQKTTAPYVGQKIKTYQETLASVSQQLNLVDARLNAAQAALRAAKNVDPFQQLVLVSQEDLAGARQGNLIAQQETLQQQLAFSQQVESAKVVVAARAVKASAHSRSSSLAVGAVIGLILGLIAAIAGDGRRIRRTA